ncbi:hypothetical protein [uncultured Clostridium sp.]|uniref:hypothetical protein n=1 Tax=uncultured Clostridium sp. TaxID=59620 RepID=UPI0026367621|nr:hypothetical protein [uncultured Clostridium sp.]
MKKKYLSILLIFITLILSVEMIISNNREEEEYIFTANDKNENKILETDVNKFFEDLDTQKSNESKKNNTNEDIKIENIEYNNKEDIKEDIIKVEEFDESKDIKNINKTKKEEIFKVDKNKILSIMPNSEKMKLVKLFSKLSMSDYAFVLDSIKNDSEIKCITKIDEVLSKRLEIKDYKVARDIFDKYINLNVIKKMN